jgi:proteasome-associated ATPase
MPQTVRRDDPRKSMLERVLAIGNGSPDVDEKCRLLDSLREQSPEQSRGADRALVERIHQLQGALNTSHNNLGKLKQLLDQVTAPPWHTAVFLYPVSRVDDSTPRVMVFHGGARRVVGVDESVDVQALTLGDEVFLNGDRTAVVGKSPVGASRVGEIAVFERHTDPNRALLRSRGEEFIAYLAGSLKQLQLTAGDQVRVDRSAEVAYERIELASSRRYLLEEIPEIGRHYVGGHQHHLETLLGALTTALVAPDKARAYGLAGRRSILMVGPPGCGKTLMARVAAAEIAHSTGHKCRFAVVKPAEWEDPYVGVTQRNIRQCFQALREAAQDGPAVLFLDEIEAVGRIRGSAVNQHNDKFLAALLAELDGFTDRSGVAVIAATNRKDLTDPALLERLSDVEIVVPRPDMRAAREILGIHLPATVPCWPNGSMAAATRNDLIDLAVSRLYAPNAANEICTLKFRDGKTRTIGARELLSGRTLEQICRAACQAAFLRDVQTGEGGLRSEDMEEALSDALQRLRTTLTPRNAHAYLFDLPQDIDVVAVEPIRRKTDHSHRYLH